MQATDRKAVITGVGALTPLGPDLDSTIAALERGDSPERETGPAGLRCAPFDARRYFRAPKAMKLADHRTQMAVAAAAMARDDAGFAEDADFEEAAVIVGTSGFDLRVEELARAIGDDGLAARDTVVFGERILARLHPFWPLMNIPNMMAAHISIQFGTRGPNNTVMTDSIAGLQAISEAARAIRLGDCDIAFAGGTDAGVLPFVHGSCAQAGLMDWSGDGSFVPADGAAMFVIEEEMHALSRGARIYGTITAATSAFAASPDDAAMSEAIDRATAGLPWSECTQVESSNGAVGFALAAEGPIRLAIALKRFGGTRFRLDSRGYLGQVMALAFERTEVLA